MADASVANSDHRPLPLRRRALLGARCGNRDVRRLPLRHRAAAGRPVRFCAVECERLDRRGRNAISASTARPNGPSAASARRAARRCSIALLEGDFAAVVGSRRSTTARVFAFNGQIVHRREACLLRLRQRDQDHDRAPRCSPPSARRKETARVTDTSRAATSPSISGRSIRRRTACCASCSSSTARSSSASIRISGFCIAAPRS